MNKKFSILVVDDELYTRDFLSEFLRDEGFDVSVADSGQEALRKVAEAEYAVILLDMRMAGMSGIDTLKVLRDVSPSSTVVVMTAYRDGNMINEAIKLGAKRKVIHKPFDLGEVLSVVNSARSAPGSPPDCGQKVPEHREKSSGNILIVDDERYTCEFLRELLEEEGYSVSVTQDGANAVNKIKENSFDVVLLDILMPGINGVEIIKTLKKLRSKIPVIIMTAYVGHKLVLEATELGVEGCLYKPIEQDEILPLLKTLVEGKILNTKS